MKITTLKELSEFLNPYRELYNTDTEEAYYELQAKARTLPLPYFVETKQHRPTYTIIVDNHPTEKLSAKIYTPDNILLKEFYSLKQAHDWVETNHNVNIKIEGKVELADPNNKTNSLIIENGYLILSTSDQDRDDLLINAYLNFLFTAEEYYKNKTNFYNSYRFVTTHPAFWYKHDKTSEHWVTNYNKFWFDVTTSGENYNKASFMFETGSAVDPDRTMHYHDPNLDVVAPTYEEGIIQLAERTDKFFYLDGSEKPENS